MSTKHLNKSKADKADEYYTLYEDIASEMEFHKHHFKDKIVYCNCDDPFRSNFFMYFVRNFDTLGLKRLVATHYGGSPTGRQRSLFTRTGADSEAYKAVINELPSDMESTDTGINQLLKSSGNSLTKLKGSGDFKSGECLKLLNECDIVVTNPPFSLFRDFVEVLCNRNKKFLILGGTQAISYTNIFPRLMSGEMNLGLGFRQGGLTFQLPEHYDPTIYARFRGEDGKVYQKVTVRWYTNLEVDRYSDYVVPAKKYSPEEYLKLDNYDAIEITRTADIPCDYDGVMGVPITSVGNIDPHEFEMIGITGADSSLHLITRLYGKVKQFDADGSFMGYASLDGNAVLRVKDKPDKPYCQLHGESDYLLMRFHRVFIRRRRS